MDRLFRKQVLEVELGLYRAEHEVGVVQTQMLLVGVGREGAATACPVLERGGGGLAGSERTSASRLRQIWRESMTMILPARRASA